MKTLPFDSVKVTSGYLFGKQELNRKTTIYSVYDRFDESGRVKAFEFTYDKNDPNAIQPHYFWDSDLAKWIESVAYIIKNDPDYDRSLEEKADAIIENIKKHQEENGYFNIYFTVVEPENRFANGDWHELYCLGHLMEAAVAYADATGKRDLLECVSKYTDLVIRVFTEERSAGFVTPGHPEIELALIKAYDFTGDKKYLDLAEFFIDNRGCSDEINNDKMFQSHKPVRELDEATGHSVRAMYLYTGMASLAKKTGDQSLIDACRRLWEDTVFRKMYVTGGIGSIHMGEAFTVPFDLSNDQAYTETCAGIGLMFFSNEMLSFENNARYADVIERVLYNGVLSGLSLDGRSFFYENPLEINLRDHITNIWGTKRYPITQRLECFSCSCCPPNVTRLIATLGNYFYGIDGDTFYINQFVSSEAEFDGVYCKVSTEYPLNGRVTVSVKGTKKVAVRIPEWCDNFSLNKDFSFENGYAVIDNDGEDIVIDLDMTPKIVYADPRISSDAGKVCVMRGPIVYCAEGVDNGEFLHSFILPKELDATETFSEEFGLITLEVPCRKRLPFEGGLYSSFKPQTEKTTLKMIPYNCFANRGETDMVVWFCMDK